MRQRAAAIANDPVADEAAADFLISGGSAVGAVLCGFFAAAGAHAGVLFCPVSIVVSGVGAGTRAFDGRLRQPGLGTKRPRGFKAGEQVPEAARVAVPTGISAALVALAYDGSQKLNSIMKVGIKRAQSSGAEARAGLLRRVRAVGAGATSEPSYVRSFLHVAGTSQGGLVTPSDFGKVADIDQPASERKLGELNLLEPGWANDEVDEAVRQELGIGYACCAIDVRGVFAALSYHRVVDGLPVDELEVEAPLAAVPVQRGVARVKPGARLPAPAPIAIRRDANGTPVEVLAAPAAARIDAAVAAAAPLRLLRDPSSKEVTRG